MEDLILGGRYLLLGEGGGSATWGGGSATRRR